METKHAISTAPTPANGPAHASSKDGNGRHDTATGAAPAAAAPAVHEENPIPSDLPKVSTAVVAGVAMAFVVLLAVLFAVGYFPNRNRNKEAAEIAAEKQDARPRVDVVQPRKPSAS